MAGMFDMEMDGPRSPSIRQAPDGLADDDDVLAQSGGSCTERGASGSGGGDELSKQALPGAEASAIEAEAEMLNLEE